ncbi:hypothetical protein AMTR_s00020p00096070 [Amborella trichopoda]|uniref:BZIP domain-containing protein n=1 Tax=Amborella trichopoda TaxID=13333 RepID=W1PPA7_AMBTC|nr:hypothetical protein AMTR_s00020p00096070 [Amborella trichopoda]
MLSSNSPIEETSLNISCVTNEHQITPNSSAWPQSSPSNGPSDGHMIVDSHSDGINTVSVMGNNIFHWNGGFGIQFPNENGAQLFPIGQHRDDEALMEDAERRLKRKIKKRESADRSRARKQVNLPTLSARLLSTS